MSMELIRLFSSAVFGVVFTVGGVIFIIGTGLPVQLQDDFMVKFVGILWLALGLFRLGTFYFRFRNYRQQQESHRRKPHQLLLWVGLLAALSVWLLLPIAQIGSRILVEHPLT